MEIKHADKWIYYFHNFFRISGTPVTQHTNKYISDVLPQYGKSIIKHKASFYLVMDVLSSHFRVITRWIINDIRF
jgi:hypothetical protein